MNCTYCGGDKFYEGPSAGFSINILCQNPKCRHWFNYEQVLDKLEDLHKIEPTEEEKETKRVEQIKEAENLPNKLYQEGQQLHKEGKSCLECVKSNPCWHSVTGADFYRLSGFIDAMLIERRK
jgi:hypothetical protein